MYVLAIDTILSHICSCEHLTSFICNFICKFNTTEITTECVAFQFEDEEGCIHRNITIHQQVLIVNLHLSSVD